jgi:uncharacterized protein (DUF2164 family)
MKNKIMIDKDKRKHMIKTIQNYFDNERQETLGDLAASLILDFIIEELGPEFYNQGVLDSYKYMNDRTEDLLGLQKY